MKAQGLSLTTIIIAAVALIVLVVLIAIFTGKINVWGDEYTETAGRYSVKDCTLPGTQRRCETGPGCSTGGVKVTGQCPDAGVCCEY
ncbi:MAG: hypothetical protein ABH879_09315 [archaeon]